MHACPCSVWQPLRAALHGCPYRLPFLAVLSDSPSGQPFLATSWGSHERLPFMAALYGCPSASCTAANQHQSPDCLTALLSSVLNASWAVAWLLMHLLSDAAFTQSIELLASWFWRPAVKHEEATVRKQTKCMTTTYSLSRGGNPWFLCWTAVLCIDLIFSENDLCLLQYEISFFGWLKYCDLSLPVTCPAGHHEMERVRLLLLSLCYYNYIYFSHVQLHCQTPARLGHIAQHIAKRPSR